MCSGFRQQYRVGLQHLLIIAKGTLSNGETILLLGKRYLFLRSAHPGEVS